MPTFRLDRAFFRRDPVTVARALLGQRLVRVLPEGRRLAGVIVETEAYLGIPDRAAHTFGGRHTPRNASMWKDGGHAYVYFTYGMHFCMNVVTEGPRKPPGNPTAVLLRALEPTEGLDLMAAQRGLARAPRFDIHHPHSVIALCSGPAKLCQALAITRDLDGIDLVTSDTLFIERLRSRAYPTRQIAATPRIGVAYAGPWAQRPLRFHLHHSPHVSR